VRVAALPASTPPDLEAGARRELRGLMQAHAGVERSAAGLSETLDRIAALWETSSGANDLIVARLIVKAALARRESRGAHFRSDFPHAENPVRTFVAERGLEEPGRARPRDPAAA